MSAISATTAEAPPRQEDTMLVCASICGGIAVLHAIGMLIPQEPEPQLVRVND